MSYYDKFKHLLDLPYIEGDQDCYGLVRRYYQDVYDLELTNYARPGDFAWSNLDLISGYFREEGFELVETSLHNLQPGDGLLLQINGAPLCNHVGVFVGNHMMLHHLYKGVSKEESYSTRWKVRTISVVRHPDVTAHNLANISVTPFVDILKNNAHIFR